MQPTGRINRRKPWMPRLGRFSPNRHMLFKIFCLLWYAWQINSWQINSWQINSWQINRVCVLSYTVFMKKTQRHVKIISPYHTWVSLPLSSLSDIVTSNEILTLFAMSHISGFVWRRGQGGIFLFNYAKVWVGTNYQLAPISILGCLFSHSKILPAPFTLERLPFPSGEVLLVSCSWVCGGWDNQLVTLLIRCKVSTDAVHAGAPHLYARLR